MPFWVLVAQGSSAILGSCCTGKQYHFGYLLHREAVPFWVVVAQGSRYLLHREAVPFWVLVAQGSSTILGTCCTGKQCHFG